MSSSYVPLPDLPATFESLNDDSKRLILQFVGNKSYVTYAGINKHCKEIYLTTEGMMKETFVCGYGSLSVITDRIERATGVYNNWDFRFFEALGKGVVLYNRSDVMEWALEERKDRVLKGICDIASTEGRIDLLDKVLNNIENENDTRYIFRGVDGHAARGGKMDVLKWIETKGLSIDEYRCAKEAAEGGQLNILKWLKEEKGFELFGKLYCRAVGGNHLHVMKWLREKQVPFHEYTFYYAAKKGNLDILQWLHDEGCPWSDVYRVHEYWLKPEVIDWFRSNGHGGRLKIVKTKADLIYKSRSKRRRLMQSYVSPQWPDLPAIFESLNDDTLTTILEFVGDKSYRSSGGVNKQCKEVYLAAKGMTKETYAPLSVIKDRCKKANDRGSRESVGKGVVY